jgi:hypothetical protein
VYGVGQGIGQNNPGVLHLQFLCKCQRVVVHALFGDRFAQIPEEPSYEAASAVKGLVKEEMVCVVFFSLFPKATGHCKRYQMPDQLYSETELCELLVGLCAVGE